MDKTKQAAQDYLHSVVDGKRTTGYADEDFLEGVKWAEANKAKEIVNITDIQIKQVIGQQEASINKIEEYLSFSDFMEYCDAIATTVNYWKSILKRKNDEERT